MTELNEEILDFEGMEPAAIDAMARRMGHVPLEDFKGDPEKWVDPETFVKRAVNELPIARGTIKNLNRKLERLEERITKQSETFEQFNTYHKTALQRTAQEEYDRGLSEARGRVRQAVEEGDVEGADAALKDAEALLKKGPDKPAGELEKPKEEVIQHQIAQAREAWEKDNSWFTENRKMAKYAYECGEYLKGTKPKQTAAEQLAEITEMVKEEFPDYFENPNRKRPGVVDSPKGNNRAGNSNLKKTYNDLPAEAQRHCDDFVAEIKGFTKEQYLADYRGPWRT